MNSNKSIEVLYGTIKSKFGKVKAKSAVKAILSNILDELEEKGVEVSEQNISNMLTEKANDFLEATKSEVA